MSTGLILTGAPGAGKTSVLDSLCTLLEIDRVPFSAIESEQFSRGYPWLSLYEWVPQLAVVVALQRDVGRSSFLVVATTESDAELCAVKDAVDAEQQLVVCLQASPQRVAERVAAREPDAWPGKAALVEHARALALEIPSLAGIDLVFSTEDRTPVDVATARRGVLRRRGIV